MSKQTNPFADFDVSKMMAAFRMPPVDMDGVMAAHRKNVEAMTKANQAAFNGMQNMVQRQMEFARQNMDEAMAASRDLMANGANGAVAPQSDAAKASIERILSQVKELSDIITKSQSEAASVINARFTDAVNEYQSTVKAANGESAKKAN